MKRAIGLFAIGTLLALGCAHKAQTPGARADLTTAAINTLDEMEAKDPGLRSVLERSAGYIVFPSVGKGGFLIGGGAGNGVLFENGKPTHFAELRQIAAGALAGGQRYSQLVIIRDPKVLQDLKAGRWDFSADASAVILRAGVSTNLTFDRGVAVIQHPDRGAMVDASLTGQRIRLVL